MWYITFHGGSNGYSNIYAYDDNGNLLTQSVLNLGDLSGSNAELRGMGFAPNGSFYVLNSRSSSKDAYSNAVLEFSGTENADHTRDFVGVFTSNALADAILHPFAYGVDPSSGDCFIASQDTNVVTRVYGPFGQNPGSPADTLPAYLAGLDGTFMPGTWVGSAALNGSLPPDTPNGITPVPEPAGLTFTLDHSKVTHSVRGVVIANGVLYVADEPGNAVNVYDLATADCTSQITQGTNGPDTQDIQGPVHLLWHGNKLYIGSSGNKIVFCYDPATQDPPPVVLSDSNLQQMTGIAIGADGALYVADNGAKIIYTYPPAPSGFGPPAMFIPGEDLPDNPEFLFYVGYRAAS